LPRCVHSRSIKHSSTCSHESIFKDRFELRCFQFLSNYGVATRQMPCQTTGTQEATDACSFRTYTSFPSDSSTSGRYRPNCLTTF